MKQRTIFILFITIFIISVFGCNKAPAPETTLPPVTPTAPETTLPPATDYINDDNTTETIKLFYGGNGNEKMVVEEREVTFSNDGDRFKVILEELILGPSDETLQRNIPENTIVYGTIRQNEDIIIDFSKDFLSFSGSMAEIIGVGSIVNTMTQFEDIQRVKILVEGEELIGPSGEPRGFMTEFPLEP